MDTDAPNPLAEASARAREDERRTVHGKAAIVALVAAVMRADPGTLPAAVREARERVEGCVGREQD
jgi:hypothetical protein